MLRVDKDYHTILWIPRAGLHYNQGHFCDGDMTTIPFDGTIHLYPSKAAAIADRKVQENKWPDAKGEFVILRVKVKEHKDVAAY